MVFKVEFKSHFVKVNPVTSFDLSKNILDVRLGLVISRWQQEKNSDHIVYQLFQNKQGMSFIRLFHERLVTSFQSFLNEYIRELTHTQKN